MARFKDKWGNVASPNPLKKLKHRKRYPNFKTWLKFRRGTSTDFISKLAQNERA